MTNASKKINVVSIVSVLLFTYTTHANAINNSSHQKLFEIEEPSKLFEPTSVPMLQQIVYHAYQTNTKISIVGAGKSQGGQTVYNKSNSYRVSLNKLNKLLQLDLRNKQVTVQAGMTWSELQQHIAPYHLAVKAMQSFNDFSIGGSLGVNPHGQDFNAGPVINTVQSFKILLANGEIVFVSRTHNKELFGLAIGGYGLFGIILEVTLQLTSDVLMDRKTVTMPTKEFGTYFFTHIKDNPLVEFYSARFSLGSDKPLEKAIVVSYHRSKKNNPKLFNFSPESRASSLFNYGLKQVGFLLKRFNVLKSWRFALETMYFKRPRTLSRNNFMGFSIESLPQDDTYSQYILQEYFIPYNNLNNFIIFLSNLIKKYKINLLNLTARHIPQDNECLLSIAPKQDACALVLYISIPKKNKSYNSTVEWTRKLIDQALLYNGTYYLPYQLIGTQKQLRSSYPMFNQFVTFKKLYDPTELFSNQLYQQYAL